MPRHGSWLRWAHHRIIANLIFVSHLYCCMDGSHEIPAQTHTDWLLQKIVQNCHSTRHKYQILHITTTAVHLSYRLLYFKPPNVAGKLISEAPYFRRVFFGNRRKAIFDVTGSPIFFFIRRMSPKKFFLHQTSLPFFVNRRKIWK